MLCEIATWKIQQYHFSDYRMCHVLVQNKSIQFVLMNYLYTLVPPVLPHSINLLRPSDAYMRQYNITKLLQIMAYRLFAAKPLSEAMLPCCQLDPMEHISVKFYSKFKSFHSRKCTWKCCLGNGSNFVSASINLRETIWQTRWCLHCCVMQIFVWMDLLICSFFVRIFCYFKGFIW